MCVILVCPKNVRPDLATLKACAQANPHGAGIAWRHLGRVRWLKTNSVEDIHQLAQTKRGEIVIHFRIASVGAVCDELRHPFPVSKTTALADHGSAKAVLFQNGTWRGYADGLEVAKLDGYTPPAGPMSDARAAAWLVEIYGKGLLEKCEPSRWVFYGGKSTSLFGEWSTVKGIQFSNLHWRQRMAPAWPKPTPKPSKAPAGIPGPTGKSPAPQGELWSMGAADAYWRHLYRVCPKPKKAG